jgi:hypothetical protein
MGLFPLPNRRIRRYVGPGLCEMRNCLGVPRHFSQRFAGETGCRAAGGAKIENYYYAASSFNACTKVSRSAVDVYTCGVTRTP